MNQFNLGMLVLRLVFGLFLVVKGYDKVFRGGRAARAARQRRMIGLMVVAIVAGAVGVGGALLQLAGSYCRPPAKA